MSCIQGSYGQRDEAIITAAVSKYYIIFYHFCHIHKLKNTNKTQNPNFL